ncbi:hypothetical protein PFISCL1PPCAC_27691, partial [Pristionchus fissidentatus]
SVDLLIEHILDGGDGLGQFLDCNLAFVHVATHRLNVSRWFSHSRTTSSPCDRRLLQLRKGLLQLANRQISFLLLLINPRVHLVFDVIRFG